MIKASLCRFYGFSNKDVMGLSIREAKKYYACMEVIQAREQITNNIVSSWSDLNKKDRDRIHKDLIKKADYRPNHVAHTASDLANILGNI